MPFLEVRELSKTYTKGKTITRANDEINFSAERGEIVGILGPNGSGKTTAIKSILGLITFDSGSILIDGKNIGRKRADVLNMTSAVLEGSRNTHWRLTPMENMDYFAGIKGLSPRGIAPTLAYRSLFRFIESIVLVAVVFLLTMVISGRWLVFSWGRLFLVLLLGVPGLFGIGLALSGGILVNKKFNSFFQIFNFALIALTFVPAVPGDFSNIYSYMPFASAAYLARAIMTNNLASTPPVGWYLFIAGNSLLYIILGLWIFKVFEKRAKAKNLLGQY